MKSLFDDHSKEEIENRIGQLSKNSEAVWGKMDVSQMMHHCQFPLKVALRDRNPEIKSNLFAKLFFKKSTYNDKPWRKNLPTHPALKVVDSKVFDDEKQKLLQLIQSFSEKRKQTEWTPHPIFGNFTTEQWGKLEYKHLDHHLQQFNV